MPDVSLYPAQPTVVVMPPDPPTIQTQRLTLRPLRIGNETDAAGLFAIRRRQEVADWLYGASNPLLVRRRTNERVAAGPASHTTTS